MALPVNSPSVKPTTAQPVRMHDVEDVPEEYLTAQHSSGISLSLQQFGACILKNIRVKQRVWFISFLEILVPILFLVALVIAWSRVETTIIPATIPTVPELERQDAYIEIVNKYLCVDARAPAYPSILAVCPFVPFNNTRSCLQHSGFQGTCLRIPATRQGSDVTMLIAGMVEELENQPAGIFRVPDFDAMLLVHEFLYNTDARNRYDFSTASALAFAPLNDETINLTSTLLTSSVYFSSIFDGIYVTEQLAQRIIEGSREGDAEGRVLALVVVNRYSPSERILDVSLRFNRTKIPSTRNPRLSITTTTNEYRKYYHTGFMSIQKKLQDLWMGEMGVSDIPRLTLLPMPLASRKENSFITFGGALVPLFMVLTYLFPVVQLVIRLVEEKELRLREGMLIMGLGKSVFYGGWIVLYFVIFSIISLAAALLLGLTMFTVAGVGVIWILFLLFGISTVTFCFLLSTLFSKSRIASRVTPLLYIALGIPTFIFNQASLNRGARPLSLLCPAAFGFAMRTVSDYELQGSFSFRRGIQSLSIGESIGFLFLDIFLYAIIGLYLDNVLPTEWGTRLSPIFFLYPSYWFPRHAEPVEESCAPEYPELHEQVPSDSVPTIHIQNLRKEFTVRGEKRRAVDNLNVQWYPNQINVLLGHNGAGKTTTLSVLTGMLPATSGFAYIYGFRTDAEMNKIRQDIGLCPQHNILWPLLTVEEHLDFYSSIKGLRRSVRVKLISYFVDAVGLTSQRGTRAGELSGGQKRKLSVAIAFIGCARVVILDEPTAGMDVQARRHTWDLIRKLRSNRTIILTTHFMDEADILGRTVGIMASGDLLCSGSPFFLKARFGVGYSLKIDMRPGVDVRTILSAIRRHSPSAVLQSASGQSASFCLAMTSQSTFPDLFRWLESSAGLELVENFGLNITTLEDVFVRLSEVSLRELLLQAEERRDGKSSTMPSSPLSVRTSTQASNVLVPSEFESDMHSPPMEIYCASDDPDVRDSSGWKGFGIHMGAFLRKRLDNTRRDRRSIIYQIILPIIFVIIALLLSRLGPPTERDLIIDARMYGAGEQILSFGNCPQSFVDAFDVLYEKERATSQVRATPAGFIQYLFKTYFSRTASQERFLSYWCDLAVASPTAIAFFNTTGVHTSIQGIREFGYAVATSRLAQPITLNIHSHPLPWDAVQLQTIRSIQALLLALFILIPYAVIPSVYTGWIVMERTNHAKHLQKISGGNMTAYWIANAVWDYSLTIITVLLTMALFGIFRESELVGSAPAFGATILSFLLYGLSVMGFVYILSFAFSSPGAAQSGTLMINLLTGFVLLIVIQVLDLLDIPNVNGARWFARLFPPYALGESLINIVQDPLQPTPIGPLAWKNVGPPFVYMAVEFPVLLLIVLVMERVGGGGFGSFSACVSLCRWRRNKKKVLSRGSSHRNTMGSSPDEDPDVALERRRVFEDNCAKTSPICIQHLKKVYATSRGPKIAVQDLTFAVNQTEVFGFLGTNGAGKTTTMSILVGNQRATAGSVFLMGQDITNRDACNRDIGYCPQFDALFDNLTPTEHLRLYLTLRGTPPLKMGVAIKQLIQATSLENYAHQAASTLSGGNKRKLSVAVALAGGPRVVLLDEPSAGMDPVARRAMWTTIRSLVHGRSLVLTTHHLEEVETLSHRLAIMDNGALACIGTITHLRSKFGEGYELTVYCNLGTDPNEAHTRPTDAAEEYIREALPQSVLLERQGNQVTYQLPQNFQLSHIFSVLESSNKEALGIADYSISQTSLERLFMSVAARGEAEM